MLFGDMSENLKVVGEKKRLQRKGNIIRNRFYLTLLQ